MIIFRHTIHRSVNHNTSIRHNQAVLYSIKPPFAGAGSASALAAIASARVPEPAWNAVDGSGKPMERSLTHWQFELLRGDRQSRGGGLPVRGGLWQRGTCHCLENDGATRRGRLG